MGTWDADKKEYESINQENIDFAKQTVSLILDKWSTHPALHSIEPVNEPWLHSDLGVLKDFYRDVRTMMKERAPHLVFVFHDAFQTVDILRWNDLFADDDHENVVMDTHQYMMYFPKLGPTFLYEETYKAVLALAESVKYDVWVGEWSLATDFCAMWLAGFNDSNGLLKHQYDCSWVECPRSYLPDEFAVDFDRTAEVLGPFGKGDQALVRKGMCPINSDHFDDKETNKLAKTLLKTFNKHVEG